MPRGVYDRLKAKPRPSSWTCPKCGKTFKGGGGHVSACGKSEEIFWGHVRKTESCWLYEGTISFEGYGYVGRGYGKGRTQEQAHRFAWKLLNGEIPADKLLLHKCDVRNCVNPEHLYLGDRKDNVRDAIERGRRYAGGRELLWPELREKSRKAWERRKKRLRSSAALDSSTKEKP